MAHAHAEGSTPRRLWWIGSTLAVGVASLVAGVATFADWRLNPSGIFHDAAGTHWPVVWETWVSWFVPVLLLAALALVPTLAWWGRRR